jgi:hypothetical protein
MIWTQLMCSGVIIFRLNTKQLLVQHIPLLGYTSLPFLSKLLHGFTEPFFRSVATPVQFPCHLLNLHMQVDTVLQAGVSLHIVKITNNEYLTV